MKTLIIALALMMTTAAAAQTEMPRTGEFTDKDGNKIGTVTFSQRGWFFRDLNGELIAFITRDQEGRLTMYDPNGKVLDQLPAKTPQQ